MTKQQPLFELDPRPVTEPCREFDTGDTDKAFQRGDKAVWDLVSLAERTLRTPEPIERARAAADVRNLAEAIVAASIRQAKDAGASWRELGGRLAVPFPTLYRRYGSDRPAGGRAP